MLAARLHDNATARDLAAQQPLTLTFRDHNNVEKTAPLPRALSLEGAPEGHDPAAGDIGYWAPGGDFGERLPFRCGEQESAMVVQEVGIIESPAVKRPSAQRGRCAAMPSSTRSRPRSNSTSTGGMVASRITLARLG